MNQPYYKLPAIGSIAALSRIIGVSESDLIAIAEKSNSLYRVASEKQKDDGSIRTTYDAFPKLKVIQKAIKRKILDNVFYPYYLQGGVKDKEHKRDYINNANIHTNKLILISDDIRGFFPSIEKSVIKSVWKYMFNFPEDVASLLTELTTKDNELPQGAATSAHLSNLVFWDIEPKLAELFEKKGYIYTRYIDDVNLSANIFLGNEEKSEIISTIHKMLARKGVKPNRKKLKIYTKSKGICVHRLNVGKKRVTLPKNKRDIIRAIVKKCEIAFETGLPQDECESLLRSAYGKVRHLKQFHPIQGKNLLARLDKINNTGVRL